MQNIWNYISNLGVKGEYRQLEERSLILSNQLNFVMFIAMFLLLLTTIITQLITHNVLYFGTLRVALTMVLTGLNLILARYHYIQLSKLSLIYLSPLVFLLGPTLIGYVEEEGYTYYPYVLICISIIPQLLLHPHRERFLYWFSLGYYFVLTLFIDQIMVRFSDTSFPIVERINTFYPFYKIAHITLFLIINACIYYLRRMNFQYEEKLNNKNIELDRRNIELKSQKDEIERQKDELVSKEISTWQKLVRIISHEIVNSAIPITNLAGMSAQMMEDESGAIQKPENIEKEVTEDIYHSLRIIESRTKGLIDFVKATKKLSDIPRPNLRKILVHDLLERITFLYAARFKKKSIRFEKEIYPPDIFIEADLELIEQVIINLIQNAIEAMEETKEPSLKIIALKNESDHVIISVSDNGPGISDDVLERIFLPYYSTKENSSGIGLSLSLQIMMLHHARLEVRPGVMNGATFIMSF